MPPLIPLYREDLGTAGASWHCMWVARTSCMYWLGAHSSKAFRRRISLKRKVSDTNVHSLTPIWSSVAPFLFLPSLTNTSSFYGHIEDSCLEFLLLSHACPVQEPGKAFSGLKRNTCGWVWWKVTLWQEGKPNLLLDKRGHNCFPKYNHSCTTLIIFAVAMYQLNHRRNNICKRSTQSIQIVEPDYLDLNSGSITY